MATLEEAARGVLDQFLFGLGRGLRFVILVLISGAAILMLIGAVRVVLGRVRDRRGQRDETSKEAWLRRIGAVAAKRGLCDRCGQVVAEVYYFPAGQRCCPKCYQAEFGIQIEAKKE